MTRACGTWRILSKTIAWLSKVMKSYMNSYPKTAIVERKGSEHKGRVRHIAQRLPFALLIPARPTVSEPFRKKCWVGPNPAASVQKPWFVRFL